jgi:anti-sigma regulatory factor (Ser/Thr protein kinase)
LCSRDAVDDVELAVGEAFANVVKYGCGGKVTVRVDASSACEFVVELTYPGDRFRTAVTYPSNRTSGEGGFGRYIMRRCLDRMEYRFRCGYTHLRMCKRIP